MAALSSIRIRNIFFAILMLLICQHMATPAEAQQATRSAIDAGQIEKRVNTQPESPSQPDKSAPEILKPDIRPTSRESDISFVLSAVNIVGATVYPIGDFAQLYEEFLGREIRPKEIEVVLERINRKYLDDGYFLTSAAAAPQDLSFGIVTIEITEGYIDRVVFRGDKPGRPGLFAAWAAKISDSAPARLSTVERYILLMNDLPGIVATPGLAETEPGSGAYEMTIDISLEPFDAYSAIDNRGTGPVGPLQWSLSGGANSVLEGLERVRVSTFTVPDEPRELLYGEIYGQVPVGSEGTQIFASASRSKVDIYSDTRGSSLQSTGTRYSGGGWHPLVRQQEVAVYLNGRFDFFEGGQSATNDNFKDRLRVGRIAARLWFRDDFGGTTSSTATFSRGFDILNASPKGYNVSRSGGESRFHKIDIDISRSQKLTDDFWLELNVAGQHSPNILLSSEEFALGGARFGRAYDPSEISDSRGIAGSAELRHRLPFADAHLSNLWVYGFYDAGVVWRTGNTKDSLASAGLGLRIFPLDGVRASLEYAKPLTRDVFEEGDRSPRVFFSLSVGF